MEPVKRKRKAKGAAPTNSPKTPRISESSSDSPVPSSSNSTESENEDDPSRQKFKTEVREKLNSGEYEVAGKPKSNRATTSDIWNHLLQVRVTATKSPIEAVQCTGCKEIYVFRGNFVGSSALGRHVKRCIGNAKNKTAQVLVDPPTAAKFKFSQACAHFCAQDLRPPEAMKGEGFINLIQTAIDLTVAHGRINSKTLVPHPTTVKTYISQEANAAREDLLKEVMPVLEERRCAATTDGWTESHKSDHYANVVLHYIKDWRFVTRLAFSISTEGASTSDQLREFIVDQLVLELGFPRKLIEDIIFTTDGGADIVKALEEFQRLYCMCHALNIVVRTAFSVKYADLIQRVIQSSPEAEDIIKEANMWVHLMRSKLPKKHELLKEIRVTVSASQSHLPMLKCIRDLRDQVEAAAGFSFDDIVPLRDTETETVAALIDFLYPFDLAGGREASASVSTSKLPLLYEHLTPLPSDDDMLSSLKNAARKELECMDAIVTIDKCKALVSYFKRSGANRELSNTLKQEVETRWNSHLTMLKSVQSNWAEIEAVLAKAKGNKKSRGGSGTSTLPDLSNIDKSLLNKLVDFLNPFQQCSDKLEGSTYPTLPYALPVLEYLKKHCTPNASDCNVMAAIREKALYLLRQKVQITMEHKIACLLWPQMKTLTMLSAEEKEEVHSSVRDRLTAIRDREQEARADDPPAGVAEAGPSAAAAQPNADEQLFGFLMVQNREVENDELKQYLAMPEVELPEGDLLLWWKVQGSVRFPTLAKLSLKILAIPAASAASERNWNDAKTLISQKATNKHSRSVNDTLVLKDSLSKKRPDQPARE